jgi:hypothetical protein
MRSHLLTGILSLFLVTGCATTAEKERKPSWENPGQCEPNDRQSETSRKQCARFSTEQQCGYISQYCHWRSRGDWGPSPESGHCYANDTRSPQWTKECAKFSAQNLCDSLGAYCHWRSAGDFFPAPETGHCFANDRFSREWTKECAKFTGEQGCNSLGSYCHWEWRRGR